MQVSVFGLGYVGCVTAACLARAGHEVVGVDVNPDKVKAIDAATSPLVEPGLDEVIVAGVAAGRLRATTSSAEAVAASDVALLCVGTPSRASGQIDLSAVRRVGREIGAALPRGRRFTVVLRSTVIPGTTDRLLRPVLRAATARQGGAAVGLAVNPEFMREGTAIRDFEEPPLTLVGCDDPQTAAELRTLYGTVRAPFVDTTIAVAETMKYAANAFHALKISFANEIGDFCDVLGADAHEVMRILRMDRKLNVSEAYLRPGFAFGGSCLPKDLRAMLAAARAAHASLPLLSSILPSNEGQLRRGVEAVLATRKKKVGIIGLAFKPGTDDLRESPMVALTETLIGKGCEVRVLDRHVSLARLVGGNRAYIAREIPHIASLMCDDLGAVVDHAEVIVLGDSGEAADAARAAARPGQIVVDLVGRTTWTRPRPAEAEADQDLDRATPFPQADQGPGPA